MSLRKAASSFKSERWDESIKEDLFPIPTKPARTRLYDKVTTVRQHYIEFYSEQSKKKTGFFELCLNWDPVKGEEVKGGCPTCENGIKFTEYHYGLLVSRKAQKAGITQVHPVRMTGSLASKILKLSDVVYAEGPPEGWQGDELPDATDKKHGFDIWLSQTEKNSKVDYDAKQGDISPLTKEERQAFEEYIADGHDVAILAKKGMKSRTVILADLTRLGIIGGDNKGDAKAHKAKQRDYDDYDKQERVPDEEEDKRGGKPQGKTPPRRSSLDEDENERERKAPPRRQALDEDDEAPVRPKPGKGQQQPWDEEDEEKERSYASADEDDAPPDDEE